MYIYTFTSNIYFVIYKYYYVVIICMFDVVGDISRICKNTIIYIDQWYSFTTK